MNRSPVLLMQKAQRGTLETSIKTLVETRGAHTGAVIAPKGSRVPFEERFETKKKHKIEAEMKHLAV